MAKHCPVLRAAALSFMMTVVFAGAPDPGPAEQAVALARTVLARKLNVDAAKIDPVRVEPHAWPDSGLGCAPAGKANLQVITKGYIVTLAAPGGERRVHVADARAIVCDKPGFASRPRVALSAHNIEQLGEAARRHLAARLGVPPQDIQLARFTATQWRNTALDCPEPLESYEERPVRGYWLVLRYRDREFTYRTDSENVRPCPRIESE